MRERRKYPRYSISVSVLGNVVDPSGEVRGLSGDTMDVSREGLALSFHAAEDTMQVLQHLLSENQAVTLEVDLPSLGGRITATGSIRWYDIRLIGESCRYFIAGISLQDMEAEDRAEWEQFVERTVGVTTATVPPQKEAA